MLRKVRLLHKISKQRFATHKLTLPAFSPTMEQGKIVEWRVKEGDEVGEGDSLAQIETDKASLEFEVFDSMVIAKILKGPDDGFIQVGDVIAYYVDDVEELKDFKAPGKQDQSTQRQQQQPEQEEAEEKTEENSEQQYPDFIRLDMPALSPTMKEGKLLSWSVEVGQEVEQGDSLGQIETDKATLDFETQDDGFVAKILQQADGNMIEVGKPLIILVQDQDDVAKFKNFTIEDLQAKKTKKSSHKSKETEDKAISKVYEQKEEQKNDSQNQTQKQSNGHRIFISPLARRMAREHDYDISLIQGSGPNGRIIKKDIENFQPQKQQQEAPQKTQQQVQKKQVEKTQQKQQILDIGNYQEIPLSGMRKVIAERLSQSKREIPHYYVETKVAMDALMEFRKTVNAQSETKISVSDFIIKAVAKANKEVPEANQQWHNESLRQFDNVDVGFAVDLGNGLITPIVKKADEKTISQIATETKDLIEKAKHNKLKPDEYQGGTITISNLGMMGVDSFTAIINPPQSCILAISASTKQPEYNPENPEKINWVTKMSVTLSCDHRVVDGAVAARWLQCFKKYMEKPMLLIV